MAYLVPEREVLFRPNPKQTIELRNLRIEELRIEKIPESLNSRIPKFLMICFVLRIS